MTPTVDETHDLVDYMLGACTHCAHKETSAASCACVPFTVGRAGDGAMQPMTMDLKVGNVDTAAIRRYAIAHMEDFLFHPVGPEEALRRLRASRDFSTPGARRERGEVDVSRD